MNETPSNLGPDRATDRDINDNVSSNPNLTTYNYQFLGDKSQSTLSCRQVNFHPLTHIIFGEIRYLLPNENGSLWFPEHWWNHKDETDSQTWE